MADESPVDVPAWATALVPAIRAVGDHDAIVAFMDAAARTHPEIDWPAIVWTRCAVCGASTETPDAERCWTHTPRYRPGPGTTHLGAMVAETWLRMVGERPDFGDELFVDFLRRGR